MKKPFSVSLINPLTVGEKKTAKFECEQKVWSPIYGNGVITKIFHGDIYVTFDCGDSWWYNSEGCFNGNQYGKLHKVCSLFPAGSHIVEAPVKDCEEKKPATFKPGDEVIWLKPVKVKLEESKTEGWIKGIVVEDGPDSERGEWWNFHSDSGIWQSGVIETHGILVHPGFTVTSGPEPERKAVYQFKDREFVLVRDHKSESWKLAAFKGYDPDDDSYPYETYNDESFKMCIPYAGNEDKMGRVTED